MSSETKAWDAIYINPFTGQEVKTVVYANSQSEATSIAMDDNVTNEGNSFYWEILTIVERKAV